MLFFFLNISFTLDLYNDNINVDIWVWLQTDKWFMFSFNNIKYQLILRICDTNISQCDIRLRQMPGDFIGYKDIDLSCCL